MAIARLPELKLLEVGFDDAPRHYDMSGIAACQRLRPDLEIVVDGLPYRGSPWPEWNREKQAAEVATAPPSEPAFDPAIERKVAERLLRLNKGRFLLGNKDRKSIAEWNLRNLPSEPFCILDANFDGTDLLDEELSALKGCLALQSLSINANPKLTAAGVQRIGPLPNLNRLWADGTQIGNDLFEWLSSSPTSKSYTWRIQPSPVMVWRVCQNCPSWRS